MRPSGYFMVLSHELTVRRDIRVAAWTCYRELGQTSGAPREDPRHILSRLGEEFAAAHLDRLGFAPLGRNERTRYGEIDLIAFDGRTLVFAEVKTRRVDARPYPPRSDQLPLHWLRPRQRIRLRKLATT